MHKGSELAKRTKSPNTRPERSRRTSAGGSVDSSIRVIPVRGLPEVQPGDNVSGLIAAALIKHAGGIQAGDIFVVAQKIISKAEGRIVLLESVKPSRRAVEWADRYHKDARVIELVLRESRRILKMERGVIVAETSHGFVCANAGVDSSNTPDGTAVLLPKDPDRSARLLQTRLTKAFGVPVGVIISDTFGRPWREGIVNVAIGVAGIAPLADYRGQRDAAGKKLQATIIAVGDEIASAAELVMGKSDRVPVVIVRGIPRAKRTGTGRDLLRSPEIDLFR